MLLVFALAALAWWGGRALGWHTPARLVAVLLVLLAALAINTLLPPGHTLRQVTGRDPRLWILVLAFGVLAFLYRAGLRRLRKAAHHKGAQRQQGDLPRGGDGVAASHSEDRDRLTSDELTRYARHIVLREIGGPGQKRLKAAHVLVIGAGGLGSPALLYLAAAGVGRVTVVDDDTVDISNLQRQVIHRTADAGRPKAESAADAMRALNPHISVSAALVRLTLENGTELVEPADLILDGTDNFSSRYIANQLAVAAQKPLISGALSQWEGQVSVFDPANGAPCYRCIFPEPPADGLAPSCAEAGVMGPLPGVVGAMMAAEAVKLITGAGAPLRGAMMIYDGLWGETRRIGLKRRAGCPVCGASG